jgi:hypothetical protein
MRKICRCDLCGNWTWSVRVRADRDVPLAIMVRSFRDGLEGEGPCSFELIDQNGVLIPERLRKLPRCPTCGQVMSRGQRDETEMRV